jgi:hypothetical protein
MILICKRKTRRKYCKILYHNIIVLFLVVASRCILTVSLFIYITFGIVSFIIVSIINHSIYLCICISITLIHACVCHHIIQCLVRINRQCMFSFSVSILYAIELAKCLASVCQIPNQPMVTAFL